MHEMDPVFIQNAFQKGSEFVFMFNHFLKKMHEGGIIDRMNLDWSLREEMNFEIDPVVNLGYENVAFPFIILVGGLAFSCILTVFEKALRKPHFKGNLERNRTKGQRFSY